MKKHLGQLAESYAIDWYISNGYAICINNFKKKNFEIDLIVRKQNCLVLVEVKYRLCHSYYLADIEKIISPRQVRRLGKGLKYYVQKSKLKGMELRSELFIVHKKNNAFNLYGRYPLELYRE